jgi:hypothetical protein
MKGTILLGILLVAVIAAGLWCLASIPSTPTAYDLQRSSMNLEFARTMMPFRIAFRVLLGGIVLLTLAGLGWGLVRWLNRRSETMYPDRAGLYPIREGRIGGATVFHDPNRTVTGSTVYADGPSSVEVRHPVPLGQAAAQEQVTTQAQATQALRAAVSGSAPLSNGAPFPLDAVANHRISRPLPEVRSLNLEPSHIERLLLKDGELAE